MFEKFETQCKEAKEAHESLIALLPDEEKDRHETWFKAKMIWVVEFSTVVCKWCEKLQEEFDFISNVETRVRSHMVALLTRATATVHAPANLTPLCNWYAFSLKRKKPLLSPKQSL